MAGEQADDACDRVGDGFEPREASCFKRLFRFPMLRMRGGMVTPVYGKDLLNRA